jgi:DNA-binding response OmpR family regulator
MVVGMMESVRNPIPEEPAVNSPVRGGPVDAQLLWEAAQRACERSQALIAESRSTLVRHTEAVAALRSSLLISPSQALPRVTSDGQPERTVDLDGEVPLGPLTLVPLRRAIGCDRGRILFTPAEWQLLAALVMNRRSTLSRAELATHAWGPGFAGRHGEVEVYISRLRRKLARTGTSVEIVTVRGQGYRLSLGGDDQALLTPLPPPLADAGA